jgi:hypothetical protein
VVLAERRQWSEATPYAGSLLVHAVVAVAVSWVLFRPIVVKYENAIDVEVIDQKDLPKAVEPPTATLRLPADAGTVRDATQPSEAGPGKPAEPPIYKPQEIGNGWYRSKTMLSEAEISDPKHKPLKAKLGQLESSTRTVQICDLEAILQIARSGLQYHPETVWRTRWRMSSGKANSWSPTGPRSRATGAGTIYPSAAASRRAPRSCRGSNLRLEPQSQERTGRLTACRLIRSV